MSSQRTLPENNSPLNIIVIYLSGHEQQQRGASTVIKYNNIIKFWNKINTRLSFNCRRGRAGQFVWRYVTCLAGCGHDGRRRRPVTEPVNGRYGKLVLGVGAQRTYRVVHGHHAADDARRLGRRSGFVRYRVVLYVVRVGVRPAQLDRRGRHVRHFDVNRRTGQRYTNKTT